MKSLLALTAAAVTAGALLLTACGPAYKTAATPEEACKAAVAQRVSSDSTGFQINKAVTEADGTVHVYYQTTTEYLGRTIGTEREVAACKNGALNLISQEAKQFPATY